MLSKAPQNPDGAETIMAAQSGGVLHSPDYPIQAWLNRVFIRLPMEDPATRLALLSLLSGIAAFVFVLFFDS